MSWPLVKLKDCCEVVGGATPKRDVQAYWDSADVPWVTPKDVSNLESPVLPDAPEYISEAGFKSCSTSMLPKGSVLVTSRAPIGNIAIAGRDLCTNQGFKSLIPGPSVDSIYLYYCMKHSSKRLQALGNGATFKEVSKKIVEEFEVPLPPLPEQKRIAAILDKADAIRRKRQQAIQLADDFLRAVFLDMFGDPVTNPKGWDVKRFKDVSTKIGSGATPRGGSEVYQEQGISLIRSLNIHDDDFRIDNLVFINDEQAEKLSNVKVQNQDILLNITGASVCRCAVVPAKVLPARVNQHVCIIRPSDLINSSYLLHLLISTPYKKKLLKMSGAGATREALTKQQIESLEIPVPPTDLQAKFEEIKAKVRNLASSFDSVKEESIFESLSNKAFSGQL